MSSGKNTDEHVNSTSSHRQKKLGETTSSVREEEDNDVTSIDQTELYDKTRSSEPKRDKRKRPRRNRRESLYCHPRCILCDPKNAKAKNARSIKQQKSHDRKRSSYQQKKIEETGSSEQDVGVSEIISSEQTKKCEQTRSSEETGDKRKRKRRNRRDESLYCHLCGIICGPENALILHLNDHYDQAAGL